MQTVTWDEAIQYVKFPTLHEHYDSFREGFRSGWFDRYLGWSSIISKTSTYGRYAMGYVDGQAAWDCYTSPLKDDGGITCLMNLLS